jgi:hypothetical protein
MESKEGAITLKRLQELDSSLDISPQRCLSQKALENIIVNTEKLINKSICDNKHILDITRAIYIEYLLRHSSSQSVAPPTEPKDVL